jgi:peptidoglycan/xylan/chitin deacetylase (PgdA/CDA1 family)
MKALDRADTVAAHRPWRALARAARTRGSAIFAYHGVDRIPISQDPELLCVPPEDFRSHLGLLVDAGFEFVTVTEFVERAPAPGLIAISFDDGLTNLGTVALPIMQELGVAGTVYVPTGLIGQAYPWANAGSGLRIMDGDEIRALADAGWEIGAHGVTHRDMSQCSYEESLAEMSESREVLERLTGAEVTSFAYPYARYSDSTERAARDAGFGAAVSYFRLARDEDPYAFPRHPVTVQHGAASILLKVVGRYDSLIASPPARLAGVLTRRLRLRPKAPLRPRV